MTAVKKWLVAAALASGAGGGAVVGLAASSSGAQPSGTPLTTTPDTRYLQQQIDSLLRDDLALKSALNQARLRLAGQVRAGERSLAALQLRIVAAQAQLARAARGRGVAVTVVAATSPATHATTGASGAGSGHSDDGGGDD